MDNFRRILVSLNEIPSGYKSGDLAVAGEFIESIYIPINENINCGTIKLCDQDKVEFLGSNLTAPYRYESLIAELLLLYNAHTDSNYKFLGGAAIITLNCGFEFEGMYYNPPVKTYKCIPTIIAQNPGVSSSGNSALTFPTLYPSSEYGRLYLKLPLSKMIIVNSLLIGNNYGTTQTKNYYKVISLTSDCYYKPLSE